MRQAVLSDQLVGAEPDGDSAFVADRILRVLDELAKQACAVLETSAIFVDAVVLAPLKELVCDRQVVGRVDVDDVEPSLLRADRGVAVPLPKVADVLPIHRSRLDRIIVDDGPV